MGTILALVLLSERHERVRCPRVQDCVSSCRLGKCTKAAAGQRAGTSGAHSGQASLTWAFAEAAVWLLRHNPAGQQSVARVENKQGQGQALTSFAPKGARAVSSMFQRATACDLHKFLHGSRSGVRAP